MLEDSESKSYVLKLGALGSSSCHMEVVGTVGGCS